MLMLQLLSREAFDSMDTPGNARIQSEITLQVAMGHTFQYAFLLSTGLHGPQSVYKPGSLFSVKYCV